MSCRVLPSHRLLNVLCSFDAEYPVAVDDEYWETSSPHTDFVQPPGVPSKISLFVTLLKLTRIVANVLKTVVSTQSSRSRYPAHPSCSTR